MIEPGDFQLDTKIDIVASQFAEFGLIEPQARVVQNLKAFGRGEKEEHE